jgi:hypothetical protein
LNDEPYYDSAETGGPSDPGTAGHEAGTTGHPEVFPWPPAEGESIPAAYARTWRGAALEPRGFFQALPAHGSIGAALLYYLPLGILVSGAGLLWSLLRGSVDPEREVSLGGMELGAMDPLLGFLLSPLLLLISLFVSAGVVHLLLRLFGGASRDYPFTTRVFAYAYSPQLLGVVPIVGTAVGFIWMVIVAIIGLREGHHTSTGRVLAAVLIPVLIGLFFVAVATFIARTGELLTP